MTPLRHAKKPSPLYATDIYLGSFAILSTVANSKVPRSLNVSTSQFFTMAKCFKSSIRYRPDTTGYVFVSSMSSMTCSGVKMMSESIVSHTSYSSFPSNGSWSTPFKTSRPSVFILENVTKLEYSLATTTLYPRSFRVTTVLSKLTTNFPEKVRPGRARTTLVI